MTTDEPEALRRLGSAFQRLAYTLAQRPDLAACVLQLEEAPQGASLAEHFEQLADWAEQRAHELPQP